MSALLMRFFMKEEKDKEEIIEEETKAEEKDEVGTEEVLSKKIAELEDEIKSLKEDELRYRAETENYRKRLLKDKENAVRFANESLIKDLLDPLDNFSRALDAADKSEDFKALKDGISMVESQLMSILKNNWGLEIIEAENKPFNPEDMEAYAVQDKEGLEEETVLSVFQRGYKLHGKVIRSAKVMVGKPVKS